MVRFVSVVMVLGMSGTAFGDSPLSIDATKDGVLVKATNVAVTAQKVVYDSGKGELVLTGADFTMTLKAKLPDAMSFTIGTTEKAVRVSTKDIEVTPDRARYDAERDCLVLYNLPPRIWHMKQAKSLKVKTGSEEQQRTVWVTSVQLLPAAYSLRDGAMKFSTKER